MGSGICRHISVVEIVRQVLIFCISVKGKKKHFHSGPARFPQKLLHGRYCHAKVLRNDPVLSQRLFYHIRQLSAGAFIPFSVSCIFVLCRNAVISCNSDEMVNSDNIKKSRICHHTPLPPVKAILFHLFIIIERISPLLTIIRKRIRWTSRNLHRLSFPIQLKLLSLRPYIGTVKRHIERNVTYDLYSLFIGVGLQLIPLFKEHKLQKLIKTDILFKFPLAL